jgi:hypothetical protein
MCYDCLVVKHGEEGRDHNFVDQQPRELPNVSDPLPEFEFEL